MRRHTHNMQRSRWPLELHEDTTEKLHMEIIHAHAKNAAGIPPKYWSTLLLTPCNATQRNATLANCATFSWLLTKFNCI